MNNTAKTLVLGNIVTLDPINPIQEAVVVNNGLVQYIGPRSIAEKLCDSSTKILDYGNNYVYPGFIEGHCHGTMAGNRMCYFADLKGGKNNAEYVEIMKKFMADRPDQPYYYGAGWELGPDEEPTAAMLDAICPDKAMILNSIDGHSVWINSVAMRENDINPETAKKWGAPIVHIYPDGTPTGLISEGPSEFIVKKTLNPGKEEMKKALLTWQDFALSMGLTAYYEAGVNEKILEIYRELIDEGKWHLRVYCGLMVNENEPDYVAAVKRAKAAADKYNCEYLQLIGLKIFCDGVIEAHTGWLMEDYSDEPGYTGVKRFCDHDRTVEMLIEAEKNGLNVHTHAIGDGAVRFMLDCYEEAQVKTGNMDMRNALAHLQYVNPEDVKRICDLNVIPVVAPLWMSKQEGYYNQCTKYLGNKRAFYMYPLRSFVEQGGIIAFHTDYPVSPELSIPESIFSAVERNSPNKGFYFQLNSHETIDRDSTLFGLTTGPAYELKQERHLGVLMIDFVANMSVFDKNFLSDPIEEVAKAKVIATIIDGQELYHC